MLARLETDADRDLSGVYTFPSSVIESVRRIDDTHILVAVDNNLALQERNLPGAADNECLLLEVGILLSQC